MGSFAVLRPKSRPLYYLAFELKIKLQQVTPASAFCNSDTSIARTRKPAFFETGACFGKRSRQNHDIVEQKRVRGRSKSRSALLVLRRYKATLNRMETSIFTRLRHSFVIQR